jgi:hypothetical protein
MCKLQKKIDTKCWIIAMRREHRDGKWRMVEGRGLMVNGKRMMEYWRDGKWENECWNCGV